MKGFDGLQWTGQILLPIPSGFLEWIRGLLKGPVSTRTQQLKGEKMLKLPISPVFGHNFTLQELKIWFVWSGAPGVSVFCQKPHRVSMPLCLLPPRQALTSPGCAALVTAGHRSDGQHQGSSRSSTASVNTLL